MAGHSGSGIQKLLGNRAPPTWHSHCALPGLYCWCGAPPLVLGYGAGALRTGSCLQSREEPCEQMPGSPAGSLKAQFSCLWCFSDPRQLPSRHTPTTLCTDLQQGRRHPTTGQPSVHTGTEQSTSGILFLHCQAVLKCDHDRNNTMLLPRGRTSRQDPLSCTWI